MRPMRSIIQVVGILASMLLQYILIRIMCLSLWTQDNTGLLFLLENVNSIHLNFTYLNKENI